MVPVDPRVKTGNPTMKVLLISYPRQLKQNRCHKKNKEKKKKKKEKINKNLNHVTKERVQITTVMQGHRQQTPC